MSSKKYRLALYISGTTPHSVAAVKNLTHICSKYLKNDCELDIIDIYQKPSEAKSAQIIAVPTLIKTRPMPERRLIGDMSDTQNVLRGLDFDETP
jgi:circadian clock protein KaiB